MNYLKKNINNKQYFYKKNIFIMPTLLKNAKKY